jgi:hypothetical protein
VKEEDKPPANKYTVRQPKDLRSKFDLKQEAKRLKQIADEDERLKKLEEERQLVGFQMREVKELCRVLFLIVFAVNKRFG